MIFSGVDLHYFVRIEYKHKYIILLFNNIKRITKQYAYKGTSILTKMQ